MEFKRGVACEPFNCTNFLDSPKHFSQRQWQLCQCVKVKNECPSESWFAVDRVGEACVSVVGCSPNL